MNIFDQLSKWGETRVKAWVLTMIAGPDEFLGQIAALETLASAPIGPLAEAPFWGDDWLGIKATLNNDGALTNGQLWEKQGRQYYISRINHTPCALILGAGHVGAALGEMLLYLEFQVSLWDERGEFLTGTKGEIKTINAPFSELGTMKAAPFFDAVVIVTRGHASDSLCLRKILSWPQRPPYVGMIGSRKRVSATLDMLAGEGFSKNILNQIHTPVGLNIGAETPKEIAVSIAAEIISFFRLRAIPISEKA
ncbi:MAG: XdhC family protein [Candidatus Adiutrix sp.]